MLSSSFLLPYFKFFDLLLYSACSLYYHIYFMDKMCSVSEVISNNFLLFTFHILDSYSFLVSLFLFALVPFFYM